MNKEPLVIISGPTASGKSDLSIKLAKLIDGEIISADSMQVYKGMDIGSAKITEDEMCGVKHYLIDVLDPKDDFNIYYFKEEAKKAFDEIRSKGKIPIIVGGTGFYIQGFLYDIDFCESEGENLPLRDELTKISKEKGSKALHDMLKELDPKAAEAIHENNVKRVIRAIEFYKETGKSITDHNEEMRKRSSPYNFAYFCLTRNRKDLYERIDRRVDKMIEEGLVEEVKRLKETGLSKYNHSMLGLGYKEILDHLDKKISLEEAIYIIKRDTRHFAKKQLTWSRREKDVITVDRDDFQSDGDILSFITGILKEKEIIG
ncbi:MAG: tRNA (adenosine(37)-N6)-dimethylallyltransferase MiaA [Lachnospiraceae bacterium]|nr:tRNA (adenosine(37)-N6)-dimethylallyltransferase MiaA [Lachnospiraceae bacterium]